MTVISVLAVFSFCLRVATFALMVGCLDMGSTKGTGISMIEAGCGLLGAAALPVAFTGLLLLMVAELSS